MARLLADEDFDQRIVESLRQLGHDVRTLREEGLANRGTRDEDVLLHPTRAGRAVLTHNRKDFVYLYSRFPEYTGILAVSRDVNAHAAARRVHAELAAVGDLVDRLIRVNRPATPEPEL